MAKIIAISNQKGGVGKTTSAINLSAGLALAGQRVLLVDLDPQGNASSGVGYSKEKIQGPTSYEVILGEAQIKDAVLLTEIEGLSLVPATADLAGAEVELVGMLSREMKLKNALATIADQFDVVMIDCPPSLGQLTVNALTAADSVLIPLQCEYFALEGLSQLLHTISLINQSTNPALKVEGIALTMLDAKTNLGQAVERDVRTHFEGLVFKTVIPRNIKLSESSSHGKPVILYDVNSKGCSAYLALTRELIDRITAPGLTVQLPSSQSLQQNISEVKHESI